MIYIVEIPHQRRASVWVATDKADFISRAYQTYIRYGDTPDTDGSIDEQFDAWVQYIRSDLSSMLVYMTDDEALEALDSTDFNRHGGAAARAELEDALRNYDVLTDDDGEDE